MNKKFSSNLFPEIIGFIKSLYPDEDTVPLHVPRFVGNEKKYLSDCIDSTYVSYIGKYVNRFEEMIAEYTGAKHGIAFVNGSCALHIALKLSGVKPGDEVLTQALTFVATANAISYCGGQPIFLDSDKTTLGMAPDKMATFLEAETVFKDDGNCYNIKSGRRIAACVPVHIFGHPVQVDKIRDLCDRYHISLVEDSAESLGSFYKGKHTGAYGRAGILSFNGNKSVTTGGGGMIITDDELLANRARHIIMTAKIPHKWEFIHDEVGYNYRMPNINAALGCAQMELFPQFLEDKRQLAAIYKEFFKKKGVDFISEGTDCSSNYWLNAIILKDRNEQDEFLQYAHSNGVMCRPIWRLMSDLEMYKHCQTDGLENAKWLEERLVNIPSSVRVRVGS